MTYSHLRVLRRHDKNILKVYYYDSRIYDSFFHKVITAGTKKYLSRKFAKRGQVFDPKLYFKRSPVIIALKNFSSNLKSVSAGYYLNLFKQCSDPVRNFGAFVPLILSLKGGSSNNANSAVIRSNVDVIFLKNLLKNSFLNTFAVKNSLSTKKKLVYSNARYKPYSRNFKFFKHYLAVRKKMKNRLLCGVNHEIFFLFEKIALSKIYVVKTKHKPLSKLFLLNIKNTDKKHVATIEKIFINFNFFNFFKYLNNLLLKKSKKLVKNNLLLKKSKKLVKNKLSNVRKFSSGRDSTGARKIDKKKLFKKFSKFDNELAYEKKSVLEKKKVQDVVKEYKAQPDVVKNVNFGYKGKNFDPNYHLLSKEERLELKAKKQESYELRIKEKNKFKDEIAKFNPKKNNGVSKDGSKAKNLFYVNFNKVLERRSRDKKIIESKRPIPLTDQSLILYSKARKENESGHYAMIPEDSKLVEFTNKEKVVISENKKEIDARRLEIADSLKLNSKKTSDLFTFELYEDDENFKEIDDLSKDFRYNKKDYIKKKRGNKNVISNVLVSNVFNNFSAGAVLRTVAKDSKQKSSAVEQIKTKKIYNYTKNIAQKTKLSLEDLQTFFDKLEKDYPEDYFLINSSKVSKTKKIAELLKLKSNYLAKYPKYKYGLRSGWHSLLNSNEDVSKKRLIGSGLNYFKYKMLTAYLGKMTPIAYSFINPQTISTYLEDFYQQMPMIKISASTQATVLTNGVFSSFSGAKNSLAKHFFKILNAPTLDYLDYRFNKELPILNNVAKCNPFTFIPKLLSFGRFNAILYARFVARRLKQRFNLNETMNVLRTFLRSEYISGYLFVCSGRFSKKQRASTFKFRGGSVPISSFSVPVQHAQDLVRLRYGTCNIKVWIASANGLLGSSSLKLLCPAEQKRKIKKKKKKFTIHEN